MGPVMSARNIALLRSHWISTILADKCEPNAAICGFAVWSRSWRIWIMSRASASDRQFPELPFESNPCEGGLRLRCAFCPPSRT